MANRLSQSDDDLKFPTRLGVGQFAPTLASLLERVCVKAGRRSHSRRTTESGDIWIRGKICLVWHRFELVALTMMVVASRKHTIRQQVGQTPTTSPVSHVYTERLKRQFFNVCGGQIGSVSYQHLFAGIKADELVVWEGGEVHSR